MLKVFRFVALVIAALALIALTGSVEGVSQVVYSLSCLLVVFVSYKAWEALDRRINENTTGD